MNITSVFYKFPDQEACIAHLEKVRWGDDPIARIAVQQAFPVSPAV